MTFNDLFNLPVQRVDTGIEAWNIFGSRYGHIDEIINKHDISYDKFKEQDKIALHYIKDFCFDGRRVFQVFRVTFEDKTVMICRRAGREGDDSHGSEIFDKELYSKMLAYINTMRYEEEEEDDEYPIATLDDAAGLFEENYSTHIVNGPFKRDR